MPEFKEKPVSDRFRNFRDTILLTLNRMAAIEKMRTFGTEPSLYRISLSTFWWCSITKLACLGGPPLVAPALDRLPDATAAWTT